MQESHIPAPLSIPSSITIGPDGRLWFADTGADKIGAVTVVG